MKWETGIECGGREELLKYLLIKTAPVMLKVRPAILIRLTNCTRAAELRHYDQFCRHQREIIAALRTDFLILSNDGRNIQIMFFDRAEMRALLAEPEVRAFLDRRGYRGLKTLGQHLGLLRRRFNGGEFPHEIGAFLGYPIKDVVGFIENRTDAVPVPRGLWRVFGDPAESLRRMWAFRFAEDIGREAIRQYHDIETCIEQVRRSVCA